MDSRLGREAHFLKKSDSRLGREAYFRLLGVQKGAEKGVLCRKGFRRRFLEAQERPKRHQEGPQEPPKEAQEPPRRPQERHKSRQESPKSRQDDPKRSQEPPRGPPEASRSHFWLDFRASGDHFRRFWLFEAISGNTREIYRRITRLPENTRDLRQEHQTNPATQRAHGCSNCFFRLRFPCSL